MKNFLLTLFAALLLAGSVSAQAPRAINYQAVARDNNGVLMVSKSVSLRVSILTGSSSGTTVYQETWTNVKTNAYGMFSILIGAGNAGSGYSFSGINWSSATHWLQMELDPNNGTNYALIGASQMVSVPYALFAEKSGNIKDTSSTNELNTNFSYNASTKILTITDGGGAKTAVVDIKADSLGDNDINDLRNVKASPVKGQILKWNGSLWVAGNDSVGTTGSSNPKLSSLADVNTTGLKKGQVLKYDGTNWVPANDSVGTGSSGGSNNSAVSYNATSKILGVTDAGGTKSATINIGADSLADNSIDELNDVNSKGAAKGKVLKFDGTNWVPANDSVGSASGGSNNTSFAYNSTSHILSITDAGGTKTATVVVTADSLQDNNIDDLKDVIAKGATKGKILKFDGTNWVLANDSVGTASGGSNNTSLTYNNTSHILSVTDAGGTKTATVNVSNDSLQDNNIDDLKDVVAKGATKGKILKFDGTNWVLANDSVGTGSSSSQWTTTGSNIYYNTGNVGVGITNPLCRLHVEDLALTASRNTAGYIVSKPNTTTSGTYSGLVVYHTSKSSQFNNEIGITAFSTGAGSNAYNFAVSGDADSSSVVNRGVMGTTSGRGFYNAGLWGLSDGLTGSGGYNYGSYGYSKGSTLINFGAYGRSDGSATFNIGVYGLADSANSKTNYGVYGEANNGSKDYAGYFDGNVNYTGTLTNVSDARFKKDVQDVNSVLQLIKSLNPKTYNFKTDEYKNMHLPGELQFGFLAQDLEKVFPSLVLEQVHANFSKQVQSKKNNGLLEKPVVSELRYKAINYIGLIPILTEAIKEQQNIIESQDKKISDLESRLEALEKKVK